MKQITNINQDGSLREAPLLDLYEKDFWGYKKAKLIIRWQNNLSRNRQIIILKKIYPTLNELPIKSLLEEIGENDVQWEFAELGWGEAMDLVRQARKKGLDIQFEEIEM